MIELGACRLSRREPLRKPDLKHHAAFAALHRSYKGIWIRTMHCIFSMFLHVDYLRINIR